MRLFKLGAIKFFLYGILFLLLFLLCYLSFVPVPKLLPSQTIEKKLSGLYETASIWVPHLDIDKGLIRQQNLPLFEKVERHELLLDTEAAKYRQLYQHLLLEHQHKFSLFDAQLIAVHDLAMDEKNNVGGFGVEGTHDHHDMSSRNNFAQVQFSVNYLQAHRVQKKSWFSFGRVKHAIYIYKDLNDILFHLATVPHTKSVPYALAKESPTDLEQQFESMLFHFKVAQFMAINSAEYNAEIVRSLKSYQRLIEMNQDIIHKSLSPLELKLVGDWGGWQSLTPAVSDRVQTH